MAQTRIAKDDLSPATRDLVDRVQRGELAIVESGGEEQVVLLDAVDFRLLRALAAYATRSAEERLGIPLRMGPASLEEARAEVEAARKLQ